MSGRNEDNNDVYNNLTEAVDSKVVGNQVSLNFSTEKFKKIK